MYQLNHGLTRTRVALSGPLNCVYLRCRSYIVCVLGDRYKPHEMKRTGSSSFLEPCTANPPTQGAHTHPDSLTRVGEACIERKLIPQPINEHVSMYVCVHVCT